MGFRQATFPSLFVCCSFLTSSLFIFVCAAEKELPCPSPCECFKENYHPFGEVNTIVCSNLGLLAVPDLTSLKNSPIPNNLDLGQNEIQAISKETFPPGLKIRVLDMNQNIGMNISEDALLNLGYSLKKLSLSAVDMIYDKTLTVFDGLFSLEELSLNNNNKHPYTKGAVQNVKATLFQGEVAKHLKRLELAYCGIRTMSKNSLSRLVNLEELNMSNNWFTSVTPAILPLQNLKFLELFYCNIQQIKNGDFDDLSKLENLDLSSNSKLTSIEDDAFSGCEDSLEKLNIQRCSITKIPTKAIKDLKELSFLDISENKLANVGSSPFVGKYKLKELVISSPELVFDQDIFKGQESNIVDLSIPRMNLKTIPLKPLRKLTNLKRLSLEYNNITTLPSRAFDGITAVSIRLEDNPLATIEPGAFEGLPSGLVISLRRTQMSDIDFLMNYSDGAIDTVNMEHANLKCRCSMKSAINVTHNIHLYGSCSRGDDMVHISSTKLEAILDQACEDERGNNSGKSLLSLPGVWVVSLVALRKLFI